jgi:uncharacterized membrane protein
MTAHLGRYPELDAARGVAVFMMIFFHLFVDLSFLGIQAPDPFSGPLQLFGLITASFFILIAGISAHIKAERTYHTNRWYISFLKRGVELILIGFGITLVTYWFLNGQGYVIFGILHLIGFCLLVTPALHYLGKYKILIVFGILLISSAFTLPHGPIWMVPIGIHPPDFTSVDYVPVIPWLGVFIIGMLTGQFLYPEGVRRCNFSKILNFRLWYPVIITGRHSLVIYLLHQPVMILILSIFFMKI